MDTNRETILHQVDTKVRVRTRRRVDRRNHRIIVTNTVAARAVEVAAHPKNHLHINLKITVLNQHRNIRRRHVDTAAARAVVRRTNIHPAVVSLGIATGRRRENHRHPNRNIRVVAVVVVAKAAVVVDRRTHNEQMKNHQM